MDQKETLNLLFKVGNLCDKMRTWVLRCNVTQIDKHDTRQINQNSISK